MPRIIGWPTTVVVVILIVFAAVIELVRHPKKSMSWLEPNQGL